MCSECGRYVWLAESGGCRNGHSRGAISFSYESPGSVALPVSPPVDGVSWPGMPMQPVPLPAPATPPASTVASLPVPEPLPQVPPATCPPSQPAVPAASRSLAPQPIPSEPTVGAGPRPPAFEAFSPGAWATAPVWALFHGRLAVALGFFALGVVSIALPPGATVDDLVSVAWMPVLLAVVALSEMLSLWLGFSANRRVWNVRAARREQGRDTRPLTIERYTKQQRPWMVVGVIARVGVVLIASILMIAEGAPPGDSLLGAILLAGTLAGVVAASR